MALYPEYMIAVDSPKFPRVYSKWAIDTMTAMYAQAPTAEIIERIEYWIGSHDKPINEAIRFDFKKMVSKYKGTEVEHVVLAYNVNTFSLEEIWLHSRQIMRQKRLKDYEILVTSAFSFTLNLDESLLDDCLPDVNLILMNFTAPRSEIT